LGQAGRVGAQALELGHVQPAVGVGVPAQATSIGQQPGACGGRLGQRALEIVQVAAQVGARVGLGHVGPEGEGQLVARDDRIAMQQQIGPQRYGSGPRGEPQRLLIRKQAQMAEQVNAQHSQA
jgi:hypothetical protein